MKRGFVFTIGFSLFFLMLLYTASIYLNMLQMREAALDMNDAGRERYFADDVGYDYLSLWAMQTEASSDSRGIRWTVRDSMPHNNMESRIVEYESFVSGAYSKSNNIEAQAELDGDGTLRVEPVGWTYSHPNDNEIRAIGRASEYAISVRLDRACAGGCSGTGSWNWGGAGDGPYVVLDIMDVNGSSVSIGGKTSGYVRINGTSNLYVATDNGGSFELRLSDGSLSLYFLNVGAETETTLGVAGATAFRVYAPLRLSVGKRTFEDITLIEK